MKTMIKAALILATLAPAVSFADAPKKDAPAADKAPADKTPAKADPKAPADKTPAKADAKKDVKAPATK